jgi:histone acetyltransferase (RNA polymerase elongator complex component)
MRILPLFIPYQGCKNRCVYCNQNAITKLENVDVEKILFQIKQISSQDVQYDEIAYYGGTFSNLPFSLQEKLLSQPNPDKLIHYRFSTRPDCITNSLLEFYKERNVATIELGVQSFSDAVLSASKRSYSAELAFETCKLIKKNGFKLGIQLMPGLPEFNAESLELTTSRMLAIKPDFVRIYPTIVLQNTILEELYLAKKFQPLSLEQAIEIGSEMKERFENVQIKVIKIGLHSDILPEHIIAGPYHQSFGELVKAKCLVKKIANQFQKDSVLILSTKDISLFKGFQRQFAKTLKQQLSVENLKISLRPELESESFYWDDSRAVNQYQIW